MSEALVRYYVELETSRWKDLLAKHNFKKVIEDCITDNGEMRKGVRRLGRVGFWNSNGGVIVTHSHDFKIKTLDRTKIYFVGNANNYFWEKGYISGGEFNDSAIGLNGMSHGAILVPDNEGFYNFLSQKQAS
jgi:hypothetical protein